MEAARRYVEFMGGAAVVVEKARAAFEAGDFRWVAEVVNHVVFADPTDAAARELHAEALEQLGYSAENATWRNFFPHRRARAAPRRCRHRGDDERTRRHRRRPQQRAACSSRWRSGSTDHGRSTPGWC